MTIKLNNIFFILQSKAEFLGNFGDNDNLKSQANGLWRQLETWAPWMVIAAVAIGILLAALYYKPFNELPGRHYRIKWWVIFGLAALVVAFVGTMCWEKFGIKTNLTSPHVTSLFCSIAGLNTLYCFGAYLMTSAVWCNCFKTNAFKIFKL